MEQLKLEIFSSLHRLCIVSGIQADINDIFARVLIITFKVKFKSTLFN